MFYLNLFIEMLLNHIIADEIFKIIKVSYLSASDIHLILFKNL